MKKQKGTEKKLKGEDGLGDIEHRRSKHEVNELFFISFITCRIDYL